jgi:hypothetical protein
VHPSDVRRESGRVVLTAEGDGDESRLEVPRERVYSMAFE